MRLVDVIAMQAMHNPRSLVMDLFYSMNLKICYVLAEFFLVVYPSYQGIDAYDSL